MKINIIAAMASNRVIGINNKLPWHIKADLKRFKDLTTGNIIVMGRKTYESMGKPLPNRLNVVISQTLTYPLPGCLLARNVSNLHDLLPIENADNVDKEAFIIGGESIYKQFLPIVDTLYLTKIHKEFGGDTYFPEYDESEWEEVSREDINDDETVPFSYSFLKFERKVSHG